MTTKTTNINNNIINLTIPISTNQEHQYQYQQININKSRTTISISTSIALLAPTQDQQTITRYTHWSALHNGVFLLEMLHLGMLFFLWLFSFLFFFFFVFFLFCTHSRTIYSRLLSLVVGDFKALGSSI